MAMKGLLKKSDLKSKATIAKLPTIQGGFNNDPRIIEELKAEKEISKSLKDKMQVLEAKVVG